jgi:hypothetical protein
LLRVIVMIYTDPSESMIKWRSELKSSNVTVTVSGTGSSCTGTSCINPAILK